MSYLPVTLYCLVVGLAWIFIPHPLVVVAAGLAPLVVINVVNYPYVVCLAFIIFSFFRIHEVFPFLNPLKLPSLLALGSLAVLGYHLFIVKNIKVYWSKELNWFAAFFGLVVIGIPFATYKPGAIAYFIGIYSKIGIMALAIVWLSRSPKDFLLATRLFTISGIVVASKAMSNKAAGIGLVEGTRVTIGRDIDSVLGDPNDLSLVLLFPASFAMSLIFAKGLSKLDRLMGLIGFGTMVAGIIATQSRGGLLGILTISGFFAWHKVKSKMVLIGGAAVLVPILLVAAGISDRSSGGAAEDGIDESAMGRLYAWEAAFNMAVANPLTGVGLDNFLGNYFFYSPHWDGMNHAVHSTWLGVLAESGFLGLAVFLTLLASLVRGLLKSLKKISIIQAFDSTAGQAADSVPLQPMLPALPDIVQPYLFGLMAGLASFCVTGSFLTQGYTWPFYILMALSVSLMKYVDSQCEARGIKI
ncbi:MAG: putative inorganic carbon (HCO3(-)) transporter [Phenylobacterium sp.]|jgi:putative inorganic carbon (HCO3(-)) transporter